MTVVRADLVTVRSRTTAAAVLLTDPTNAHFNDGEACPRSVPAWASVHIRGLRRVARLSVGTKIREL